MNTCGACLGLRAVDQSMYGRPWASCPMCGLDYPAAMNASASMSMRIYFAQRRCHPRGVYYACRVALPNPHLTATPQHLDSLSGYSVCQMILKFRGDGGSCICNPDSHVDSQLSYVTATATRVRVRTGTERSRNCRYHPLRNGWRSGQSVERLLGGEVCDMNNGDGHAANCKNQRIY